MNTKIFLSVILLFVQYSAVAEESNFYDDRERGWYWYEVEPIEEDIEVEELPKNQNVSIDLSIPSPEEEVIAMQRELFNKSLASAVVNPTPENMRNYVTITQKINEQSGRFAAAMKQYIWTNPKYDYSLTGRPTTTQAIVAYSEEKLAEEESTLYKIAEEKGILYFFRSDCPYCARFAPILKKVSETFGFTIIAVSLDGKGTKQFPYPKSSHFMAEQLNVSVVPATFLVDPNDNSVSTIGYGYSDWTKLIAKILSANKNIETNTPTNVAQSNL